MFFKAFHRAVACRRLSTLMISGALSVAGISIMFQNNHRPKFRASCENVVANININSSNRKIVVLADGTFNKPFDKDGKQPVTNVTHIARALVPVTKSGTNQLIFYHWGLATGDRGLTKIIAQRLWAKGFRQNVIDCYRFIVHNHEPGDELYLFGFSRGAATVLSLAGMLATIGIIPKEEVKGHAVGEAYELYLKVNQAKGKGREEPKDLQRFKQKHDCIDTPIKFIGLFDTVFRLGLGKHSMFSRAQRFVYGDEEVVEPHTRIAPENVEFVAHAVAIDEQRRDFEPTLQGEYGDQGGKLTEVWFPGNHCDIGGGHGDEKENHLADYVCKWMINQAKLGGTGDGLEFAQSYIDQDLDENVAKTLQKRIHLSRGLLDPSSWSSGNESRKIPRDAVFDELAMSEDYLALEGHNTSHPSLRMKKQKK